MKKLLLPISLILVLCKGMEAQTPFNPVGSAAALSCSCYKLTDDVGNQGGAAWNNNTWNLNTAFDFHFAVFLGTHDSPGADGICFVLQNTNTNVATAGGGLGYQGFPNQSIAIELDTYQNTGFGDPAFDHIALESMGNINHNLVAPIQASATSPDIEDGAWHDFRITWDPATNTISAYFDNIFRFSYVFAGGLVSSIFGGNPTVYWGFTGATGGESNLQQFCLDIVANYWAGNNFNSCSPTLQFNSTSQSGLNTIIGYAWNFGDGSPIDNTQNPIHTYAAPGTYNVNLTITDQSLCTATQTYPVTIHPMPQANTTITHVSCNGAANGSINLNAFSGTSPYSVSWSPSLTNNPNGPTNFVVSGLSGGSYTATLVDQPSGCSTILTYVVDEPTPFTLNVSHTDVTCPGAANGTVTLTLGGGTPPYTYNGMPIPAGTTTLNNIPAGTFSATVTDFNGCIATGSVTVLEPGPQSVNITPVNNLCNGGSAGSVSATMVNGTGSVTYVWNGGAFTGQTWNGLTAGTYTVTATDAQGCTVTNSATLTDPPPFALNPSVTHVACFGDATGSITLAPSGGSGGYSYVWNPSVSSSATATNLSANTYGVTATDGNGCASSQSFTITQPAAALSATAQVVHVLCFGQSTGSVTMNTTGGTTNYTYTWTPNVSVSNVASSLTGGSYDVLITDANGCTVSYTNVVNEPASALTLAPSQSDLSCYQSGDGSAQTNPSGGTGAYSFVWNPNVSSASTAVSLTAGLYQVTVSDANGCSATNSFNITQPPQIQIQSAITHVLCFGDASGSISLTVSGGVPFTSGSPYLYNWSPNVGNSDNVTNLVAGSYSVTVTDETNCTASQSLPVTEPPAIVSSFTTTDPICNGLQTGAISISAQGGTGALTYSIAGNLGISQSNSSGQFNNLGADVYNCVVTDQNGCTDAFVAVINEPPAMQLSFVTDSPTCFHYTDGSLTASASGGTLPYTYSFGNGETNNTGLLQNIGDGNYVVTVTDNNGCSVTGSAAVYEPYELTVDITPANAQMNLGETIQLGSVSNYSNITYSWSPAFGLSCTNCANPVSGAYEDIVYQLVVTNGNGCVATDTVLVHVVPDYQIFLPNVFSPNGDGINDVLSYQGNLAGIKQLYFAAFNRWGEKVFESNDLNFAWDGRYKGEYLSPGVYTTLMKFVFLDNFTTKLYSGTVTIVR